MEDQMKENVALLQLMEEVLVRLNPNDDSLKRLLSNSAQFCYGLEQIVIEFAEAFDNLLSDTEAFAWIVKHGGSEKEAGQIVFGFRQKVRALGVKDEVKIHAVFHSGGEISNMEQDKDAFRRHAAFGWHEFQCRDGWGSTDPHSERCLVSWIPRLLAGSVWKSASAQTELVLTLKAEMDLPDWYEMSFGSVNHIGGMLLAHFKATGENVINPLATTDENVLKPSAVRTDTFHPCGYRLEMAWFGERPCYSFCMAETTGCWRNAIFAVGMVKATRAKRSRWKVLSNQ